MELIPYLPEFHPIVAGWWKAHEFAVIPHDALPKTGYIAVNEKREMVCAAWLYKTDSTIALINWFISDPLANKMESGIGQDLIIEKLSNDARDSGFLAAMCSIKHEKVVKRLVNHKFKITDDNATNLVRNLWE